MVAVLAFGKRLECPHGHGYWVGPSALMGYGGCSVVPGRYPGLVSGDAPLALGAWMPVAGVAAPFGPGQCPESRDGGRVGARKTNGYGDTGQCQESPRRNCRGCSVGV